MKLNMYEQWEGQIIQITGGGLSQSVTFQNQMLHWQYTIVPNVFSSHAVVVCLRRTDYSNIPSEILVGKTLSVKNT